MRFLRLSPISRLRSVTWAEAAEWLAVALLAAVSFLWRPRLVMPTASVDGSWLLGMNQIVVDRLRLGTDVILTFGPLSRLYTSQYHPELFRTHCIAAAVLSVLYACLLRRLLSISFRSRFVRCALMLLTVPLAATPDVFWYAFAPLGLLVILSHRRPRDGPFESFFWFGMALISLIKSSFGISSLFLWTAELCLCIATRRARWALLAFPLGGLLIWIEEGQSLASLPQFFANTLQIASGYGEAMERPLLSMSLIWGFWVSLGSSAVLLFHSLSKRPEVRFRGLLVGTYLLLCWSLFKAAFVVAYVELGLVGALLMAAFTWIACWRDSAGVFGRSCLGVSVVAGLTATHAMSELYNSQNVLAYLVSQSASTARLIANNASDLHQGGLARAYANAMAAIREKYPLPALHGNVDVYRTRQALAFAYGMKWDPRLVFQSYAAYTPRLIEQNRQHLLGPASPDNIVMDLVTTDNRYPMLDDGISLLEILARFQVTALPQGLALFAKRSEPIGYRFTNSETSKAQFDTLVQVRGKGTGLVWVWLELEKSVAGRAVSLLYRGAIIDFEVKFAQGAPLHYRMVPGASQNGFLLSPLVTNVDSYSFLNDANAHEPPASARVTGFELHVEPGLEWMYQDAISIRMAEVVFDSLDHAQGFSARDVARLSARHWRREDGPHSEPVYR
jgi:hypothetical protein